jgi:hypothetical protein
MQDKIDEKTINLAVRVGKLTADELKKALDKLVAKLTEQDPQINNDEPDLKHGKQTLKQLSKHNDGLSSVELKDPNLRFLHQSMKSHNVDFAAVKDGKGMYTLFFKGKDADSVTHAIKQSCLALLYLFKTFGQQSGNIAYIICEYYVCRIFDGQQKV